jgi:hypothetical protein
MMRGARPWSAPAPSSMVRPGMGTFVIWPGMGILPWRHAATLGRPRGCRGRQRPIVSMAMTCRAGQIDGGPRADHYTGTMQAHHPVRDTGRGEKRCHRHGGPPGEDRPGGQARLHHHLHTHDLHAQSRCCRRADAGAFRHGVDLAATPAPPCINRHARSLRL